MGGDHIVGKIEQLSGNGYTTPTSSFGIITDGKRLGIMEDYFLPKNIDQTKYKFDEGNVLEELAKYIKDTYSQHYAAQDGDRQLLEDVEDAGDIVPVCRWNASKYLRRYGKKAGYNRDDLFKSLHYIIILLGSDNKGKVKK